MSVNFTPLTDRVLIEPDSAPVKTKGGIIIPTGAKQLQGTVVAIGDGKDGKPLITTVGRRVVYGQYSGSELKLDGKTYLVMKEEEIYGFL